MSMCDVRDFGAVGDGVALDTASINAAMLACSHVVFPEGRYLTGSIMLRNHLSLTLAGPTTAILAQPGGIASPEPNPHADDAYQDFAHSHWHDSLLCGDAVSNVTIIGNGGTLDGNGALTTSADRPPPGQGAKLMAFRSSSSIRLSGFRAVRGGGYSLLATDVSYLSITDVAVRAERDGIDLVGCSHVVVERLNVSGGGDDAFALKSDWSLGRELQSFVRRGTCRTYHMA